jgi:hypothetical protein
VSLLLAEAAFLANALVEEALMEAALTSTAAFSLGLAAGTTGAVAGATGAATAAAGAGAAETWSEVVSVAGFVALTVFGAKVKPSTW